MPGLDDTDHEILRLLLEDARRPYSDIAERVDLSAPAVSDRVDRLVEMGLIQGFTVDVDRSLLQAGVPVLIEVDAKPGRAADIAAAVSDADTVERVYRTAGGRVVLAANVSQSDASELLAEHVDLGDVDRYEVRMIADSEWTVGLGTAEFAPDCAECGNSVDEEGEQRTLDGERYYFCCGSCAERFVDQYESLKDRV
ncbi:MULTISPECIES: winged helix-turn-helix transcriptional regulator [Haloarcula]|uniref:winged helix-turn-helix transcriptional regulator n=1 Tax=Haloarcula TaxID=2237 RepID=UPI0011B58D7A|nr:MULTISPECIES: winged helix-turn-helix transcriptional regulator [Haloarcula]KAA9407501.1 winged helix-turn-helix transcriptional regulator [Haloarcula sp. CBA1131]MUV49501.1 winged helix-turn-helix transcriptional regulator [Haloarcula sp. CBA1122]